MFRAKLTQHTAFERADNTEPAAVTALAVSKYERLDGNESDNDQEDIPMIVMYKKQHHG